MNKVDDRNFLSPVPQAESPTLFAPYSVTLLFCLMKMHCINIHNAMCNSSWKNKQEPN